MELENLAQYLSEGCKVPEQNIDFCPQLRNIGQIYTSGGRFKPTFSEILPVLAWAEKYYNYENNTCTGFCRHYKQVVWSSTSSIGCGRNRCIKNETESSRPEYLIVCLYKPAGNLPNERPYKQGVSCSECAQKSSCFRNQCVPKSSPLQGLPFSLQQRQNGALESIGQATTTSLTSLMILSFKSLVSAIITSQYLI
uniref:SCP domain-containing protein n=1 Tax=Mesocestoides corti TaxID=53468 RepID=A0A5K3FMJ5_MESCO